MALLTGIITAQSFELVRDQIGLVLAEEIANQVALLEADEEGSGASVDASVFIERIAQIDENELPVINVTFMGGEYSNKDQTQTDGGYRYAVDVYVGGKSGNEDTSDQVSRVLLGRLMGMCRAIMDSPQYRTLGLTAPFNCSSSVGSINISEPSPLTDQQSISMGRLIINVRIPEYVELQQSRPMNGYQTKVKLSLTDKGYKYGPYQVS